ncbi:hypothetical protein D9619_009885 [Psilocybe cf. subviscida]|uniref:Uncharacterized protein n=1 Tax=Psilocybe cf. subviscida TaxID=2480587 RepID=A0A8H5F6A8_9AGAR|nr:hypothetical protein D9619_009885 [Psilocybe cf. subviscida]
MLRKMKSLSNSKMGNPPVLDGLTGDHIKSGFQALDTQLGKDAQLRREKRQIRIICSGGVCAVAYLRSRATTKDIDFYTPHPDDSREITYARYELNMHDARGRARYPDGWINCEMGAHINNLKGGEVLFANSVKNGVVLYTGEHLVVYAADWKFQFVGKVKRAFDNLEYAQEVGEIRTLDTDKDFGDALHFLNQIMRPRNTPLALVDIKNWYNYGHFITPQMAKMVNICYAHRFADDACRFSGKRVISI